MTATASMKVGKEIPHCKIPQETVILHSMGFDAHFGGFSYRVKFFVNELERE
jgi:hypothetical protein